MNIFYLAYNIEEDENMKEGFFCGGLYTDSFTVEYNVFIIHFHTYFVVYYFFMRIFMTTVIHLHVYMTIDDSNLVSIFIYCTLHKFK